MKSGQTHSQEMPMCCYAVLKIWDEEEEREGDERRG